MVAETYAEVIGVLSETHFTQIHKYGAFFTHLFWLHHICCFYFRQFMTILSDLKKDSTAVVSNNVISLLMAMKFVKIKVRRLVFLKILHQSFHHITYLISIHPTSTKSHVIFHSWNLLAQLAGHFSVTTKLFSSILF